MIEVKSGTALATVQDLGRFGHYGEGVGRAGAMDALALVLGNALLGNGDNAAGIEIPLFPFKLAFSGDFDIAVTGADCAPSLDGQPMPPDWAFPVCAGQTLILNAAREGCRAYVCVSGGIDVPEVLGSRSTQLRETFGGHEGRMLQKGDVLRAASPSCNLPHGGLGAMPAARALPLTVEGQAAVRVLPGAEYEGFGSASRKVFWDAPWQVTAQSNRNGYRLSGPDLVMDDTSELRSHGIVPGVIQVPVSGQPIVQLADAATMGGYAKIGTVIEADQWRLAQIPPGGLVRFIRTDHAQAVAAQAECDAYLSAVRTMAARQRAAAGKWP